MNEPTHLPRVYGEQEIGRILKRATEMQLAEPSAPPAAGVTLSELEQIAGEAGIDAIYLRRAAIELDTGIGDRSFWSEVVGEELTLARQIALPGELDQDGFERLAGTIQSLSRLHGQPSLLGRTLTWRAETPSKQRTMQIVVTSRDGATHIRLEESLNQLAAGMFAGGTAGVGIGVGLGIGVPIGLQVIGSAAFAVAAPIGFVALSFLGCRAIYREVVIRRRRAIDDMFDRIVAEAQASIAAAAPHEE